MKGSTLANRKITFDLFSNPFKKIMVSDIYIVQFQTIFLSIQEKDVNFKLPSQRAED